MPVEGRLIPVTSCQICGSSSASLMFEESPHKVLECSNCSLVYVTPRLCEEDLPEVYGDSYWKSDSPKTHGYADYASDAPLYLKTFRRRMRFVQRWLPDGSRVLDMGCAAGFFLRVMAENGYDVQGIELSPAIAAHAREQLGDDHIWVGTFDSVPDDHPTIARGSYDLVTMWDVIEHIAKPQDLLKQARAMLKPGGMLILETQNVASRFATLLGSRWQHYKHQEHLYHFNPQSIRKMLGQCGFEVVHNTSAFGGKYVSFGFIAERAARINKIASLLMRPLTLLKNANVYLNFGDEMVVVARPINSNNSPD